MKKMYGQGYVDGLIGRLLSMKRNEFKRMFVYCITDIFAALLECQNFRI